jgi:hypothetical protein
MVVDGLYANTEQLAHLLLGEPKRLVLEDDIDTHGPVRRGVQQDFVIQGLHVTPIQVRLQRMVKSGVNSCRYLSLPSMSSNTFSRRASISF